VHDLMAWLEASALGHAMRESGPWTYAIVNLAHILGVSALVLRRTGVARAGRPRPLAERASPSGVDGPPLARVLAHGDRGGTFHRILVTS
jgi:hypothetical protein